MAHLRLEKAGLRGLAIAESFSGRAARSVLAGVVMRRDGIIDGFAVRGATIGGNDATDEILAMYRELKRDDVGYVLISGMILSMYNMVDIGRIHGELGVPVIGITYRNSGGIRDSIRLHFQDPAEKLRIYEKLGRRERVRLHTSGEIFVRSEGCTIREAGLLLDSITLQGSIPEPVRIARLLARVLVVD